MIIWIICFIFAMVICVLACLMSYELRIKSYHLWQSILPNSRKKLIKISQFTENLHNAATPKSIQSHWYLQQWWILIAGFLLFASILIFAMTRPIRSTHIETEYLKTTDPQIYALLDGELLSPPPEIDAALIQDAVIEATRLEAAYQAQQAQAIKPNHLDLPTVHLYDNLDSTTVNRKWNKLNPRYSQRLLMVFKIMKQQYGYDLVLLEGYRSPTRQNMLAKNVHTTRAKGYQSYHQFGLAGDIAFKRHGKVIISERDPWAMRGYQLYGQVAESVGLTWGGRWKSIQDYGHTEYRMPNLKKTKVMAEKLVTEATNTM